MTDDGSLTVGRHAAGNGDAVHPIVAAALQQQTPAARGAARHGSGGADATAQGEGGLGWPGFPADGTGLGWPGDATSGSEVPERADRSLTVVPGQPARRRLGWRRFFGGAPATDPGGAGSSSAA
jgi:hypothetical protein